MKPSTHPHPQSALNIATQYGGLIAAGALLVAAPVFLLLPLLGAPSGFIVAAPLVTLLAMPLLMLTAYAPAVSVDDAGITLHPAVWRERTIPWDAITAVAVFPLLPSEDAEVTRRYAVGRKNYRVAEGIMLVIPGLPPQYRIVGFLAGTRSQPTIALTNRAHQDYDTLLRKVLAATPAAIQDEALHDDA